MKINSRRESRNIAMNYSSDIDYNNFVKIYGKCTKELYCFLTIDTTLPANDPLNFRKKMFLSYKNDSN